MTGTRGSVRRRRTPAVRAAVAALSRKAPGPVDAFNAARPRSNARFVIGVKNEQTHVAVSTQKVRRTARLVLAAEEVAVATISVALVDNRTIRHLNRRHLNHDYETDVLSFLFETEQSAAPTTGARKKHPVTRRRLDGEIVISAEMAVQSAPRFGWSPSDELALYLVHGLLHLCGYDDKTIAERRRMRKRERAILRLLDPE